MVAVTPAREAIDALEIYSHIKDISDPEHPYTLEQLKVMTMCPRGAPRLFAHRHRCCCCLWCSQVVTLDNIHADGRALLHGYAHRLAYSRQAAAGAAAAIQGGRCADLERCGPCA